MSFGRRETARVALLCSALACSALWAVAVGAEPTVFDLHRATFLRSSASTPPPADVDWRDVGLPHVWDDTPAGELDYAWYRIELPPLAADARGRIGVQLPKVILNAAVFLNGYWLGECGRMTDPIARCWNVPLFFEVDPRRLTSEDDVLHVRLAGYTPYARLGVVRVGDAARLAADHERLELIQVDVSRVLTIAGLVFVLFMTALWIGTRDPVYGFFALAAAVGAVNGSNFHLREPPLPHWIFEWALHAAIEWFVVLIAFLVHRLFGLERPRLERGLLTFGVVSSAAIAFSIPSRFHDVTVIAHGVSTAITLYLVWVVVTNLRRDRPIEALPWVVLVAAAIVFSVHDLLAQSHVIDFHRPRYGPQVFGVLMLTLGTVLTLRFLRHFARASNLNVELDLAVRAKQAELEQQHAQVRELEHVQVVAQERERIMRELHDGLGGQLVSTIAMVESGESPPDEVADAVRGSLDDMHMVIDSLDPVVEELNTLLGMVRGRLEPRLKRQGLHFEWAVSDVPRIEWMGPHELLNVLRIVQEAITNVAKHADARTVRVATGVVEEPSPGGVFVEIEDDGRGLRTGHGVGRGMGNMHGRAREMGAELTVTGLSTGVCVRLFLPLRRVSA